MKRMLLISVILLIIALAVGCACAVTPTPSPSPRVSPGTATSPGVGTSPKVSPGVGTSPKVSPSTGVSPGISPGTSPGTSPGGGKSGQAGIPGFAAGTEINLESVPDIKSAVAQKYPNSNILSVVYAMYQNEQVYNVSLTEQSGQVVTINVRPDGTFIDETGQNP